MNTALKTVLRIAVVSVAATVHLTLLVAGSLCTREWLVAQATPLARLAPLVPLVALFSFIWPLYAVVALPMAAAAMKRQIEKKRAERGTHAT